MEFVWRAPRPRLVVSVLVVSVEACEPYGIGATLGFVNMTGLFLALFVQAVVALSPGAAARIAPVEAAIRAEREAQARMPPPANDAERLVRLVDLEQAGRKALIAIDLRDLPTDERNLATKTMWAPVMAIDLDNQKTLVALLPPEGWFYRSRYGTEATEAAFLIVQHAGPEFWRRFVPVLEPLVAKGEVSGKEYALMYDRLAISEGRPQRYGSQFSCRNGKLVVDTLEDPAHVDARRKTMGFTESLDQYAEHFRNAPIC
jgi:hypothetical protein